MALAIDDRLSTLVEVWLADERPAWETVDAFERDVENVLRGCITRSMASRMPLRVRDKPPRDLAVLRAALKASRRG